MYDIRKQHKNSKRKVKRMSHFSIIFGTRPEYLKLIPIIKIFQKQTFYNYNIIYIQQHNRLEETIEDPHVILTIDNEISTNRLCCIGAQILIKLPKYITDSTHIIVQGDTATAYYSALTAFQLQKKIIHIEAGLRTYDLERPYPEEGYRQMISRIANIHFTPHEDSSEVLMNEKVGGSIHMIGNTILDLVHSYKLESTRTNIVLITFHRRENWDKIDFLMEGLKKLVEKTPDLNYFWYLHPNPDLQEKVREGICELPSIQLRNPCNHREFTENMAKSNFIITDSGGIQEEASFLGKHCIVLRSSTERSHIPREYITMLEDYTKLDEIYENIPNTVLDSCHVYGYGNSAEIMMRYL
jgi:UDP-N-acetylglucosamine 2-epimerase (non-hydrolysing)